jgi:hypothetical protein
MNSPFFVAFLLPLAQVLKKRSPGADRIKLSIALMPALGTGLVFLLFSIRKGVEVNWYAMGLALLPLAMAYVIESRRLFKPATAAIILSFLVTVFFLFPALPDQVGMAPLVPLKADGMKRLAGWKDLAAQVKAFRSAGQGGDSSVLITDSYHIASELAFYTGDENVVCLNNGSRRMNQFDLWENRLTRTQDTGLLAFYISDTYPPANQFFRGQVLAEKQVPVLYRGHEVRRFYILVVRDFKIVSLPGNSFSRF